MNNHDILERCFFAFSRNLAAWMPDGLIEVDAELLATVWKNQEEEVDRLQHYFQVFETPEKITLLNDRFIIWIVPLLDKGPSTYTLIALRKDGLPQLEMGFVTHGNYNSSKLVLKLLEHYLGEIEETEEVIAEFARHHA